MEQGVYNKSYKLLFCIYAKIKLNRQSKGGRKMTKEFKKKFKVGSNKAINEVNFNDSGVLETFLGELKSVIKVEDVDFSEMGIDDLLEFVTASEGAYTLHLDGLLARVAELTSTRDKDDMTEEFTFKVFKLMNLLKYSVLPVIERLEVLETSLKYFVSALRHKFVERFLIADLTLKSDVSILGQRELELNLTWKSVNMKLRDKATQTCLWEFKNDSLKSCAIDRVFDCFLDVEDLLELVVDDLEGEFDADDVDDQSNGLGDELDG